MQATDISCLTSTGDGYQCMIEALVTATGGEVAFGFLIGGFTILILYVASSYHPAPPAVGTLLLGGILVPALPAQYRATAQVVMLMGFIAGVFVMLRRYSLEVGR